MLYIHFKYRINSGELDPIDANLSISKPFNRDEVINKVKAQLKTLNLSLDTKNYHFLFNEGNLSLEGFANEIAKTLFTDLVL